MTDGAQANDEKPSRIPEFQSLEEEAEFWDTHDFTDYLDELRPVQVRFSPNLVRGGETARRQDGRTSES